MSQLSWPRRVALLLFCAVLIAAGSLARLQASAADAGTLEGIPRLSHIFVIVLENESYSSTWGPGSPAPYLNSLRGKGVLLDQYYGAGHLSNDNYISMTSGQPPSSLTMADCPNWFACEQYDSSAAYGGGASIADQMEGAGLSWKGYMDGMPAPCTHASVNDQNDPYQGNSTKAPGYNYADRHNPFIYYAPIVDNATRCVSHVVPYTQLATDFAQHTVPNLSYIVPDTCHDGHDNPCADGSTGGLVAADAWLRQNVPSILNYVTANNGLLAITFDESANSDTSGCCGAGTGGSQGFGGRVGLLAISPHIIPSTDNSTPYDHPSLLRTIEDAFGISTHLNNAGAASEHAMTDVFANGAADTPTASATATRPVPTPTTTHIAATATGTRTTATPTRVAPTATGTRTVPTATSTRVTATPTRPVPTATGTRATSTATSTAKPTATATTLPTAGPNAPTGSYGNGTLLPNGRLVSPVGQRYTLGDLPLGVALSPDGALAVAINSGQGYGLNDGMNSYCTSVSQGNRPCPYASPTNPTLTNTAGNPNTHAADESLSVVNVHSGNVSQVKAVPTSYDHATLGTASDSFNFFYTGVVFSPDGTHLYASGGGNDKVYDFAVIHDVVGSTPAHTIALSSTVGPVITALPSTVKGFTGTGGFTKGLATTPDGRYLLVTHELNNSLDVVDTSNYTVKQLYFGAPLPAGGSYPYGVAVSPDGATAYVALQGAGSVAVVHLASGVPVLAGTIAVGDHPTAVALSPDATQLYVTNADDDTLSIASTVTRLVTSKVTLHAVANETLGSTPNALAVNPDGTRIYVAMAGDNAIAVLSKVAATSSLSAPTFQLSGLVPAGWYPSAVAVSHDGNMLYAVSAKGLGSQPTAISSGFQYDGNNMPGLLQVVPVPAGSTLSADTTLARQDLAFAGGVDAMRGANNPIPAMVGGSSPITHVVFIVRENRTFDQVLGDAGVDEGRTGAQLDAYPGYTIFGRSTTPNAHALVGDPLPGTHNPAYATSDNFYSDGEASIQGHYWTSSSMVNDYVEKTWAQYYSPRNHVYDPISTISEPHNCSIFQSALARQAQDPTFSFRDYGELTGIANPTLTASVLGVGNASPGVHEACPLIPNANVDLAGGSNLSLDTDDRATARHFLSDVGLNADGSPVSTANPATNYLRNFSYVIMAGDHTGGLQFTNTPRSRVAQNDAGLGLIVQALSRSKYWSSTAVFVVEDDSQDGLDHRDGHRNLLYAISPYAKHTGADGKSGYIGHRHYSQASVLKTIDLILGFPFLSTYDQNASPLYDLFQNKNQASALTSSDLAPFTVEPAPGFINETSAQYKAATAGTSALPVAESSLLNLKAPDLAGPMLEIVNWQLAHPSQPVPAQLQQEQRTARSYQQGADTGE